MALRLTGTSATTHTPFSPAELAAQADVLLATGEVARYGELFARPAGHDDPNERYHAHLALAESGLRAARSAAPSLAGQIYLSVSRALVDILAAEPREPQLLSYAGIAFYELWSLDAARALFKAAQRLDPQLPQLRSNLRETDKRRRSGQGPQRRPLHTELPALARRAQRLASAAKPAQGLTLSLCMIVRDEEEMLPRCLAAAAPAVDEIVIVDTGSTDRTIEIARSFGARVIEREWTGSFSEARNVSFEAATSDWLMYLDADEVLVEQDVAALRALTGQTWREAFYLIETSFTGEQDDSTGVVHNSLRVFRNRERYRFEGRLHEQVTGVPHDVPGRVEQTTVRVQHYGYLGAIRDAKAKSERNIELLRAQQSENAPSAFLHFNLGMEYAAAGDPRGAVRELERSWTLVRTQGLERRDFVPALLVRLANSLVQADRSHDAIALADDTLRLFPGFTDLVFAKGWALADLGKADDAAAMWRTCLTMGDAPARYCAAVGAGSFLPMLALANHHIAAGEPEPARELLARCLQEHPSFGGAVGPYASLRLAQGLDADAVIAEVAKRTGEAMSTSARFMLATALHSRGALAAAESQYRLVLQSRPGSAHVRVILAEMLLGLGRYDDAAELVREVADSDPFAPQAARIAVWATIGAGALDQAPDALARAREIGVPASQLEVFEQWAALAAGEPLGRPLPVAATPLLGVILETLLRHHDFTAFESLLALLQRSQLPRREQREVLASMYLRFGFLQSAAQEWMAVCDEQPDARAMAGLARVAVAHGLQEDALTFASHAVALDPTADAPRSLLDELTSAAR